MNFGITSDIHTWQCNTDTGLIYAGQHQPATSISALHVYCPSEYERIQADLEGVRQSGEPVRVNYCLLNGQGVTCLFPVLDAGGNKIGVAGITEVKPAEPHCTGAAKGDGRSRRQFLANMSHELRTPMNSVLGMTAQLLKTDLNPKQSSFATTLEASASHLLCIINDLLDYATITEGQMQVEKEELQLRKILDSVHQSLKQKAREKHLGLSLHLSRELPCRVLGDAHRLEQVLRHVVGNAIKYTEQGSVQIECFVEEHNSATHTIAVHVSDTGIGMDKETLSLACKPFAQGDERFVRRYGGTGLGLALSKALVNLMGGSLELTSQKDRGTQVRIELPFALPDGVAPGMGTDAGCLQGRSVLLVEDNKFNALVARLMLHNSGMEVTHAENGADAVEAVRRQAFDVILMDIQMPIMDGITATCCIREELNCKTPIIAFTAHALPTEKKYYLSCGMNDFLTKPAPESDLVRVLQKWVGQGRLAKS